MIGAAVVAALLLTTGSAAEARWITTWAAAPTPPSTQNGPLPPTPSFQDRTLRQTIRLSAGGQGLRVRFTNAYGPGPLVIGGARVALVGPDGNERPDTSRVLTFGGAAGGTAAKAAPLLSDALDVRIAPLAKLSVTIYLPVDTGPCTCHPFGLEQTEVSATGNHLGEPFVAESKTGGRAFLAAVEVDAPGEAQTIAVLGDSISDGVGSSANNFQRWPDLLAQRLADRGGAGWGIANQGISGNRVLGDGAGESALARFDRDILSLPGVTTLILFEGVNDLGLSFGKFEGAFAEEARKNPSWKVSTDQMIAGYRQLVARAHANGLKVYGATIAPYKGAFYWSEEGDQARQTINAFIRTGGLFDAVIDFDQVLRDPSDAASIRPGFHPGDHLHGSDAGYKAMADAIDLALFPKGKAGKKD
jgi:lysophospholipase L1-like esterase